MTTTTAKKSKPHVLAKSAFRVDCYKCMLYGNIDPACDRCKGSGREVVVMTRVETKGERIKRLRVEREKEWSTDHAADPTTAERWGADASVWPY